MAAVMGYLTVPRTLPRTFDLARLAFVAEPPSAAAQNGRSAPLGLSRVWPRTLGDSLWSRVEQGTDQLLLGSHAGQRLG